MSHTCSIYICTHTWKAHVVLGCIVYVCRFNMMCFSNCLGLTISHHTQVIALCDNCGVSPVNARNRCHPHLLIPVCQEWRWSHPTHMIARRKNSWRPSLELAMSSQCRLVLRGEINWRSSWKTKYRSRNRTHTHGWTEVFSKWMHDGFPESLSGWKHRPTGQEGNRTFLSPRLL